MPKKCPEDPKGTQGITYLVEIFRLVNIGETGMA